MPARPAVLLPGGSTLEQAAGWTAFGAAASVYCSNAVAQILLGLAIVLVLLAWKRLEFPPVRLPLALFVAGTLLSVAFSADPYAGTPQLKKFYVFFMLPVLYTAVRSAIQVRNLFLCSAVLATGSAGWSFLQFFRKRAEAAATGEDFYLHYVARRVTGFMGHWMTFSAEQMIAALLLGSLLLFGVVHTRRAMWTACLLTIAVAIGIAWTRSVWLGTIAGACYLVTAWRPKLLVAVPVVLACVWMVAPAPLQERMNSLFRPHGNNDSNEHRRITFRTGIEMIRTHPWLGLGPEMPGRMFGQYVPSDIPKPLPAGFYGHLHNVYVQYAAERGLPVLGLFLWVAGKVIVDFVRGARHLLASDTIGRAILHGAVAGLTGLLVEGFFEHNLGDSEVLTLFFVIVASGYIVLREAEAVHG